MTQGQSDVSEEELAARSELGRRYTDQMRSDQIDLQVRGIRISVKILKEKELELLAEKDGLRGEGNGK